MFKATLLQGKTVLAEVQEEEFIAVMSVMNQRCKALLEGKRKR